MLNELIEIIEKDGYRYRYNESCGNHEFISEDETISVYDYPDNLNATIREIKEKFSYLF